MPRRFALATAVTIGLLASDLALAGGGNEPIRLPFRQAGSPSTAETVVVVVGDHLWKISERRLETVAEGPVTDREVAPYWRLVVEQNADNLRSGDPNLIYPGEVVELPDVGISATR